MIRIVSDSSSDLFSLEHFDYKYVPMKIVTAHAQYTDGPDLDVAAMLEEIHAYKGRSGSSCPNTEEWLKAFEGADEIIAIAISSNMSGSYNAAHLAAEEYLTEHENAKVYVIDSLSAGPGLRLMIDQICDNIRQGLNFDEVVAAHKTYFPKVKMLFSLESFHNLAANGRVNPAVAALCGMLNIRVLSIASEIGTVKTLHKCRGDKKLLANIEKEMENLDFDGKRLRIAHCQNKANADAICDFVRAQYPDCDIEVTECGGLCGFYAQKGGVLLSFATR